MKILFATPIDDHQKSLFSDIDAEIIFKDRKEIQEEDLKDVDAVLGNLPYSLINKAEHLQWLQLDSAGIGHAEELKDGVILTNARGAYGEAISEHMLAETLAITKNLYHYYDQQITHTWRNLGTVKNISDCTVLSLGMGDIGSSYAKKMHMLGSSVYGIRRTVHERPDYLKELGTMENLKDYLPMADIVALSLPETKETRHIINRETISMMKTGAILLNVGRGSAVDQNALYKAMKDHKLSAAALDVTDPEPLPVNDPLWNCENVYITPHISGKFNAESTYNTLMKIYHDNLERFTHHEPLHNIVDIRRGY